MTKRSVSALSIHTLTGLLPSTQPWQMVGTRLSDVLAGTGAPNNPRLVTFIVVDEMSSRTSGGSDVPIVDFATAYISSVQDAPGGGVTLTATFLPSGSGGARRVALIE